MACGCNKGAVLTADGTPAPTGTDRVMVSSRQVYESSSTDAAKAVGERFTTSEIYERTGNILTFEPDKTTGVKSWVVSGSWLKTA